METGLMATEVLILEVKAWPTRSCGLLKLCLSQRSISDELFVPQNRFGQMMVIMEGWWREVHTLPAFRASAAAHPQNTLVCTYMFTLDQSHIAIEW